MRPDVPARLPTAQVIAAIGGICMAQSLVSGIAFQGVPALLRDSGAPLDQIGLAYLAFLPWALKFLWAPWIERYRLPGSSLHLRLTSARCCSCWRAWASPPCPCCWPSWA